MKVTRIGATAKDTGESIQVQIVIKCEETGELAFNSMNLPYILDTNTMFKTFVFSSEAVADLCKMINQPSYQTLSLPKR